MRASYPTYKSTSIPWLPEMPEHWDLIGLNLLFRDNKNKNKGMVESLVLSLSYGNIIRKQREENFGLIPESFETYQILEPGYIVMRLTDLQNDKRSLRVGYVKERGIITSAYTGLVPGKVDSKYYYYLLHYLDIRKHFYSLGGGVRQSSDYNEIKKTKVPLPPLTEQTAIANYLDAKSEQINRFIAKKEKLIALLKEQKQVVINELLEYKEGKWERRKLKYIVSMKSGNFIDAVDIHDSGDYPVFGGNGLRGFTSNYTHEGEYILIGRQGALCGNVNFAYGKFWPSEHAIVCTPKIKFDTLWFGNAVRSLNLGQYSQSAAQPGISIGVVSNVSLPYPDYTTQQQISEIIKSEGSRIDETIKRIEKEIEKVKELKQSLIAEVVTGRIKVA